MAKSLLAAIHDATRPDWGGDDAQADAADPVGGAADTSTGPEAHSRKGTSMSAQQQPAAAGVTQADQEAAVAAAEARGRDAERQRLTAALGAEQVSGDGTRMAAALDLAIKAPGMAGADVAAHVVAHVPASKASPAASYEQDRLAGQAQPQGDRKAGATMSWADFRARRGKA